MRFILSIQQVRLSHLVEGSRSIVLLFATVCLLSLWSTEAVAAGPDKQETKHFDIPRQRADVSLITFAEQADITLIFTFELARDKTTNRLVGSYHPNEAIQLLLDGTGLEPTFSSDGHINIALAEVPVAEGDEMKVEEERGGKGIFAVIAASFIAAGVPDNAEAQSDAEAANEVEEIVVTGSRVTRSGFDTPTPVAVLSQEVIERSGMVDLGEVIRQAPQIGIGLGSNNDTFERDIGSSYVDLRSLGISRTLVLVDGRRRVAGSRAGSQVDLSAIPAGLVERVEVITGGASAVYGADAVSGVVNIITKKDVDGLIIDAQLAETERGDGELNSLSIAGGGEIAGGAGSFSFGVVAQETGVIRNVDRSYTWRPNGNLWRVPNPANTGPSDGIPDNVDFADLLIPSIPFDPTIVVGGQRYIVENGAVRLPNNENCNPIVTVFCQGGSDGYDSSDRNLRTPKDVFSGMANMRLEVAPDVDFTASLHVAHSETKTNGQSFFDGGLVFTRDNPTLPSEVTALMDANGLTSLSVGIVQNQTLGTKELENRRFTFTSSVGLEGRISDRFDWELFYQYGRRDQNYSIGNTRIESRFFEAIDVISDPVTGDPVCRSDAARAAGCVPLDIWSGLVSDADKAYFEYQMNRNVVTEQNIAGFQIVGDLFELPAGNMTVAGGAEYREDSLRGADDGLAARGELYRTDNGGGAVEGEVSVAEVFVEAVAPIASDLPGIHDLALEGAVRFSDYDTIGSTTAWKTGLSWAPVDSVRFRGTVSRSVRAPNLFELFAPGTRGTLNLDFDPCDVNFIDDNPNRTANCRAVGIPDGWIDPVSFAALTTVLGGNPNLDEEESDSWTVGLVFDSLLVDGLRIAVDYWNIEITGAVETIDGDTLVQRCYDSDSPDNVFCQSVTRGGFVGVSDPFAISQIDLRQINIGSLNAAGIDFAVNYVVPRQILGGDVSFALSGVYLEEFEQQADASDSGSLIIRDGEVTHPTWRGNYDITYDRDRWQGRWRGRYIGSVMNVGGNQQSSELFETNTASSKVYHDLFVGYEATESLSLRFGVNNVFDTRAPRTWFTYSGTFDAALHDNAGRSFFAGATMSFK